MKIKKIDSRIAALYLWSSILVEFERQGSVYFGELVGCDAYSITLKNVQGDHSCRSDYRVFNEEGLAPYLRRLESITDEEARELCEIFYGEPVREKIGWSHLDFLFQSVEGVSGPVIGSFIGSPAVWLKLLEWGFDLFGLVDAGLAKDVSLKNG